MGDNKGEVTGVVITGAKKFLDGKKMDLADLKKKLVETGELVDPTMMDTNHEKKIAFALAKRGLKTQPQFMVGKWVFDFKVVDYPILIEIDGSIHRLKKVREKDYRKDRYAQKCGFKVLRYSNKELTESTNNCEQEIKAIMKKCQKQPYEMVIFKMTFWSSVKEWFKKKRNGNE